MTDNASDIRRARAAFGWVGIAAPLALLAGAAVVLAIWLPGLPDPVAAHWGIGGVDGFAPRWTVLLMPLLGAVLVIAMAASVLLASRSDSAAGRRWSATSRFLGAMALGLGGMLATLAVTSSGIQRGLREAGEAGPVTGWVLLSLGLAVVLGAIGWFLQPAVSVGNAVRVPVAAAPLAPSERAVWFGTVSIARPARLVIGGITAAMAIAGVTCLVLGARAGWLLLGLALLLAFLMAIGLVYLVRVSDAGVRVRSTVGWPDTRIPIDEVVEVAVVPVDPFAEFGGWGWRYGTDGRRGVVMRRGEALQVTRSSGQVFVVTVDGAAEAASVLQAMKERRAAARPAAEGEGSA